MADQRCPVPFPPQKKARKSTTNICLARVYTVEIGQRHHRAQRCTMAWWRKKLSIQHLLHHAAFPVKVNQDGRGGINGILLTVPINATNIKSQNCWRGLRPACPNPSFHGAENSTSLCYPEKVPCSCGPPHHHSVSYVTVPSDNPAHSGHYEGAGKRTLATWLTWPYKPGKLWRGALPGIVFLVGRVFFLQDFEFMSPISPGLKAFSLTTIE
jgi:hypothetical protein